MSQRAAILEAKGTPIVVKERPIPTPSDDQILVRIKVTAVNIVNVLHRDIGFFIDKFPTILGSDAAGIVEKVGGNVSKFKVGDRVVFEGHNGEDDEATFQEYALANPKLASKIPDNITDIQASTLPMSCATAFTALFSTTGASFPPPFKGPTVPSGSSIVTLAASGPVGQMAVQFARVAGFSNIITTAGKRYEPSLKGLGATHVLDREDTKDGSKIRAIAGDIKVVIDMASKDDTLALALSILGTEGGTVVRVLRLDPNSAAAKTIPSNVSVKFILGIFGNNKKEGLGEGFYEEVHRWLEEGVLKPNEVIVFEGIERVNDAIDRQASKEGTSGKKIVVKFE